MNLPLPIYFSWLRLAWFLRKTLGIKTYGIGWAAKKVGLAFDFKFRDYPFRFLPAAARSYCLLPAGIPNEPETHQFLAQVLDSLPLAGVQCVFIDVGASIGEFAIPMAHNERVARVIAFEPHPATAGALRASAELGPMGKIQVIERGLGAAAGLAAFDLNDTAPTAAGLGVAGDEKNFATITLCTLDETIQLPGDVPLILLIDIEGGELEALRGGQALIARHKPLMIFEYNATTRRFFQLSQVEDLLGAGYRLFRLRTEDGRLDHDLSSTWNVVAVPKQGFWQYLNQSPDLILG